MSYFLNFVLWLAVVLFILQAINLPKAKDIPLKSKIIVMVCIAILTCGFVCGCVYCLKQVETMKLGVKIAIGIISFFYIETKIFCTWAIRQLR